MIVTEVPRIAGALHIAAQRGQNSMIEYLAGKGAKLDRRDKQGRTPLELALGAGGPSRAQGRAARAAQVNEKTAALLRDLLAQRQDKP